MAVDFKVGDLVWARMKGFPAWPAKVVEPTPVAKKPAKKGNFVFVFFFGSENYAWISSDGIWPFRQNKDKFNLTTRTPKYFKEALEAAEEACSLHSSTHPEASADGENGTPGLLPSIDDELKQMFPDRSPSLQAESPGKQARQRRSNGGVARRSGNDTVASGQQDSTVGSGDDGDASKAATVLAAEAGTVGTGTSAGDSSAADPAASNASAAVATEALGAASDGPHARHTEEMATVDDGYSTPQPSTSRARGKGSRRRATTLGRGDRSAMPTRAAAGGSHASRRGVSGSSRGGHAAPAGLHGRSPRRKKPGTVVTDAASIGDGVLVDPVDIAASTSPVNRRGKVVAATDQAVAGEQHAAVNGKAGKGRDRARPAVAVDVDSKGGSTSAESPAVTALSTPVKRGRPAAGSAEPPTAGSSRRRTLLPADEPTSKRPRVTSPSMPRHAAEDGVDRAVANTAAAGSARRRVLSQSRSQRSSSAQRLSSVPSSSPLRHGLESGAAAGDGSIQVPLAGVLAEANAAAKSPARRRLPSTATDHRDKLAAVTVDGSPGKDRLVGFLGLGVMGTKAVQRLMKAGYQLLVWNRTQARCDDLATQGARFGETPADVVRQCDITFSCVSDPFALKELVFGDCGVLAAISPGKLYIDMSTVDIDTSKDIDEAIAAKGGSYVEAPVMGGHVYGFKQAEAPDLVVLAGGSPGAVRRCHSHLAAIAGKVVHVGDVGFGACMKLCSSAVVGVTAAAIAECATLAERLGLKRAEFFDVLCPAMRVFEASGSSTAARAGPAPPGPSTIVDAMIASDFTVDFALKHQQKDLRLTIDMADMVDKPMQVTAAANEFYKLAKAHGYGSMDVSAVWKAAQQQ